MDYSGREGFRVEALDARDRELIREHTKYWKYALPAIRIFVGIVVVMGITFSGFDLFSLIWVGMALLFLVIGELVIRNMMKKMRADLAGGKKVIIEGEAQKLWIHSSGSSSVRGEGTGPNHESYWIRIHGEDLKITEEFYLKIDRGDFVRIMMLPSSRTVFAIDKIKF